MNRNQYINLLFYVPGTGMGVGLPNAPFSLGHLIFGDKERIESTKQVGDVLAARKGSRFVGRFSIERAFTSRDRGGLVTNRYQIPGAATLVCGRAPDPANGEIAFDASTGSTAGHTYQRFCDYNLSAARYNRTAVARGKRKLVLFKLFTVIDAPGSTDNLEFMFANMLASGISGNFFDQCISASKGLNPLLDMVNKYNMETSLIMINGGAGYMNGQLIRGSRVSAVVLTHGKNDHALIGDRDIDRFVNGNRTRVFVYSNSQDGHNQASLIFGSHLDASCRGKSNREYQHSYLPLLCTGAYFVSKGATWSYTRKVLNKDRFVNKNVTGMKGGSNPLGQSGGGCGCGDSGSNDPYGAIYNRIINMVGGSSKKDNEDLETVSPFTDLEDTETEVPPDERKNQFNDPFMGHVTGVRIEDIVNKKH